MLVIQFSPDKIKIENGPELEVQREVTYKFNSYGAPRIRGFAEQ